MALSDTIKTLGDNIISLVKTRANKDLSNLSSLGESKLGGGSGGLELCDIGMALYVNEAAGKRRRLNGSIVDINDNTRPWLNRLTEIATQNPDLLTTEENWQSEATLNVDGCVYKYVMNYNANNTAVTSVRLPKYPDYIEVTSNNIPVAGNGLTLGVTGKLNNTTTIGNAGLGAYVGNGDLRGWEDLYGKTVGSGATTASVLTNGVGLVTDASKSGIQTSGGIVKLKLYYFIQIATGQETKNNITNDIQLNNPFSFGVNQYFKGEMDNLSWLKSTGDYKPKGGYPSFYNWILTNANANKAGFKLSTASGITDYDFVVNTTNETFRLPLKNGQEGVFASGVKGNGKSLGFTTGSKNFGLMETYNQAVNNVFANRGAFNVNVGKFTPTSWDGENDQALGLTTDPTKSGIIVDITVPSGWNLYYYVGETVQNANLIDAGRIAEELGNKQDVLEYKMVDSYISGTSGYNVWKTPLGYYCEQWGRNRNNTTAVSVTISFLKKFANTDYSVLVGRENQTSNNVTNSQFSANSKTQASFLLQSGYNGGNAVNICDVVWRASGYLATGEY